MRARGHRSQSGITGGGREPMLRILIADDHDVVRSGLRSVLEARSEWTIVGEARDGKEAIQLANQTKPDIAVIDYGLPVINGIEAIRQIKARHPQTEVLMFTMHDDEALIAQALEAGARAYLLKSDARAHLLAAVEALAVHKPFFTGQISETLLNSFLSNRPANRKDVLAPRERIVVQLIAEGHSNREISEILHVSVKTVEAQRASAMRKLQLTSTAALVRYAIRNKFIQP
jgi:DNA-binding NarL/FixJ family response regulator